MIGIIGAMAEEIQILKEKLEHAELTQAYGYDFYLGLLAGKEVVLVQSGIGKVNATITVSLLKQIFDVDVIINTGSAGALDTALEIGDVLIAHSLIYHDVNLTAFDYDIGQMAGMPAQFYPDTELMRLAQESSRQMGYEPYIGLIVSGDQFISQSLQKKEILNKFPKARACEMESTAIAHTCYSMDIPFLIIRAISDAADGSASMDFDEFIHLASQNSAKLVEKTIEKLKLD